MFGLVSLAKKIYEMAQYELTDETKIKEELLRLQMLYEMDEMTDEEYEKQEGELLERLTIAREAKER